MKNWAALNSKNERLLIFSSSHEHEPPVSARLPRDALTLLWVSCTLLGALYGVARMLRIHRSNAWQRTWTSAKTSSVYCTVLYCTCLPLLRKSQNIVRQSTER